MNLHNSNTYLNDLNTTAKHIIDVDKLRGKKILITGATGTVGSYIADTLLWLNQTAGYGIKVILAGRDLKRLSDLFSYFNDQEIEYVYFNLKEDFRFDFEVDYIIHAAGNAHPQAFNLDPVGTLVDSVNSTKRLLDYGFAYGAKRLLYISSGEVYGLGDVSLDAFKEEYLGGLDLASPRSCYPESKRVNENLCVGYSKQYGLETVSVRLCHTYGPMITATDNRAQVQFIRNALEHHDIELKSAGLQMRSYNYIADAAAGILTVLMNGISGETYNIANPEARITIAGLAQVIAENEGQKVVFTDPDAVDLANRSPIAKQVLDTTKLEGLGWKGVFSVENGIKHILQILRESERRDEFEDSDAESK